LLFPLIPTIVTLPMQPFALPPHLRHLSKLAPLFFIALFIVLLKFPQVFMVLLILGIAASRFWPHIRKLLDERSKDTEFINIPASSKNFTFLHTIPMHPGKIVRWVLGLVVLGLILVNSIVIVPAGATGVYHLFGKVRDEELSSGIHLINPFARITLMSVRTEGYTMSIAQGEGNRSQSDAIDALTKEGLTVTLDLTIFYRLQEMSASDVFKNLGTNYEEKIIRPSIRAAIREVIAGYEAKDIYSEKRDEAAQQILSQLDIALEERGFVVENVLLRNVILPPKLAESIQSKLTAEQESERYDFILDKEKKEADRKRIEAEGQRDAQKTINESLTDRYLNYLYIQQLKDKPGTFYVPVSPANGLPLFKNVP